MNQSNPSNSKSTDVECKMFDDVLLKKSVPVESLVDTISLSYGVTPALSSSQSKEVSSNNTAVSRTESPKTFSSFNKYFEVTETKSYAPKAILDKFKYYPPTKNEVGQLYQLEGINHHLFVPKSQVYKDILQSVQVYDHELSAQVNSWTIHVIASLFRFVDPDFPEPGAKKNNGPKEQWFPLKEVSSLVSLCRSDLVGQGNLNLSDYDSKMGHTIIWNLMDGMHRALAVCEVLSTTDQLHLKDLKVNVVVYQLKERHVRKALDYESIMGSVTRNSACIRDFNYNLTGTSHEAILLMLTQSSFRIKVPPFHYDQKKNTNKKTDAAADTDAADEDDPISNFITDVKKHVQNQLQSITNLKIPEQSTENHRRSPFITKDFIKSYFQPSRKRPTYQKKFFTEPPSQMLVRFSDHLITLGMALSCSYSMDEMIAYCLKDLDGYLNESKLGKKQRKI